MQKTISVGCEDAEMNHHMLMSLSQFIASHFWRAHHECIAGVLVELDGYTNPNGISQGVFRSIR
jgi:hypothetical protein